MMTPEMRALYFKVLRGHKPNLPILHMIDAHVNAKEILEFLIGTGLTGSSLNAFVQEKCGGEPIRFFAYVTKEILKLNQAPALLRGKHIKV